MSDTATLNIRIHATEEEAIEALRQVVGHLLWGDIDVIYGSVSQ